MTGGFPILWRQLTDLWGHFGLQQKVSTIFALIVTVVAIGGLLYWSSRPSYRLLYANMPLEEAAKAQEKLEEKRILVKLSDSGHALYVPADDVYRSRLLLASAGMPKNNNVGFEMFAEPKFGLTDFAQQVNYQRALQGELQNTIMAMDGITSARVLLVLPKGRLFSTEDAQHPTASVIVNVPQPLSAEQIRSLTHLVAAGVPGLRVADITITDQNGRLMSRGGGSGSDGDASGDAGNQMETRAKIEEMLARKGQRMLDLALGTGRSTVQVSADLDFSRTEKERETLDSEGRVATSESISSESSTTPGGAENRVVGVSGNIPVAGAGGGSEQGGGKTKKEDINTKYQVPRSVEKIREEGARIRGLSVSVCIAADKQPRTKEAREELIRMVGAAVGVVQSETRKDSISVVEMAFPEPPAAPKTDWRDTLWQARGYASSGAMFLMVLITMFFLRRRAVAGLDIESSDVGMPLRNLAPGEGNMNAGMNRVPAVAHGSEMELISSIAEQEPKTLATWISSVNEERK